MTSSSVPWMTRTGEETLHTLSILEEKHNKCLNQSGSAFFKNLPREGVKEPRPLRLRERDPHAGHERGVENNGPGLIPTKKARDYLKLLAGNSNMLPRREVDGGHSPDALSVEDDVLRADSVLCPEVVPRRVDVAVKVLLGGLAGAGAVAGVVVREDVAVDARAWNNKIR